MAKLTLIILAVALGLVSAVAHARGQYLDRNNHGDPCRSRKANEAWCHRALLRDLLTEEGATMA